MPHRQHDQLPCRPCRDHINGINTIGNITLSLFIIDLCFVIRKVCTGISVIMFCVISYNKYTSIDVKTSCMVKTYMAHLRKKKAFWIARYFSSTRNCNYQKNLTLAMFSPWYLSSRRLRKWWSAICWHGDAVPSMPISYIRSHFHIKYD